MHFYRLALATAFVLGGIHPFGSPQASAQETVDPPVVEVGLTSPLETFDDVESFSRDLAERLVWTVRTDSRSNDASGIALRFTAVRIDRGRVTASYQSDALSPPDRPSRIAESLGSRSFMAFPDVCLSPDDPPASVRALSGRLRLDRQGMERAIAGAASTRELDRLFGLDEAVAIEWGRHVVLVLAAVSEDPDLLVRPLIIVLDRQ